MSYWWSAVHHDDKRTFTTNEIDEELQKRIYNESLVHILERLNPEGSFERDQTCERDGTVNWYDHEDADNITLKKWLSIILTLKPN